MENNSKPKLVIYLPWKDFRLTDNPALFAAVNFCIKQNLPFLPIFTMDDGWAKTDIYNLGYPRRFALSQILSSFSKHFQRFEVLVCEPENLISELIKKFEIYVFLNDDVEPFAIRRHKKIQELLQAQGNDQYFFRFKNELSVSVNVKTQNGHLYSVFTPFKQAVWDEFLNSKVLPKVDLLKVRYYDQNLPVDFEKVKTDPQSLFTRLDQKWILKFAGHSINLDDWFEKPKLENWTFEEEKVFTQFDQFNQTQITTYHLSRDNLSIEGTSKMSMALAFGLVSARILKDKILQVHQSPDQSKGVQTFLSELVWREFYRYILIHFPKVLNKEFQSKYQKLTWRTDQEGLVRFEKWIKGQTGYPLVDAAMNQIIKTGWMHNRTRMVVASILTKNLGIDWRWGQEFFRAALIDLDEASNNGGWQWSASVGADPKPIRIFNPYLQAEKYDSQNIYIQKWLPQNYNAKPIIEHAQARNEAISRYKLISSL